MVREGFPPISKPLPAILQGSDYEDSSIVVKTEELSTFEKESTLKWFYSLCNNIIPPKWANSLFTTKAYHFPSVPALAKPRSIWDSVPPEISKPVLLFPHTKHPSSGRDLSCCAREAALTWSCSKTIPEPPRLSWTDWHSEDLLKALRWSSHEPVESGQQETTDSGVSELKGLVEDAVLQADDLDELDIWTNEFAVDMELIWEATDRIIFQENPAAWETLTYLLGDGSTIENVRTKYSEGQRDIDMLSLYLSSSEADSKQTALTLWRIWAYCILSIESFILGKCIAVQMAWLRGSGTDRALLGRPRLNTDEAENWKLCHRNGIFAQCNKDLSKSEVDDMVQIWILIKQKWADAMAEKELGDLQEKSIMYMFSRVTGPKDLLNVLQGLQHNSITFPNALRIRHRNRKELVEIIPGMQIQE